MAETIGTWNGKIVTTRNIERIYRSMDRESQEKFKSAFFYEAERRIDNQHPHTIFDFFENPTEETKHYIKKAIEATKEVTKVDEGIDGIQDTLALVIMLMGISVAFNMFKK